MSRSVIQIGKEFGIDAFNCESSFDCEDEFGEEISEESCHAFASIVLGALDFDAYYVVPHDYCQVSVLIRDERLRGIERDPLETISFSFPQLVQAISIPNQKEAFIQYLKSYDLMPIEDDFSVRAERAGVTLECKFDCQNRFHELNL